MAWFPSTMASPEPTWSFGIVGLLAVLGGSTIEKYKQPITASHFGGFPRLLPAPNTLVNPDRPARLPSAKDVTVVGVYSGTLFSELNFFANVIHDIESLAPYEFRAYTIRYATGDIESLKKRESRKGPRMPIRKFCPLNMVTLLSILMTAALIIWAGVIHDGPALVGLLTMSLSTCTACLSSQWYPKLSHRPTGGGVPPGDMVIKSRGGAFVVVHCTEEIARELYGGMETCEYAFNGRPHQMLLASSTILLMAGIILFSNAGKTMQIAIGVAYIILNILYWGISLLTTTAHTWDTGRYVVDYEQGTFRHKPNYTEALWLAIHATGEVDWVEKGGLAPSTKYWKGWLNEAKSHSMDKDWDAVAAKDRWMGLAAAEHKEGLDQARQPTDEEKRS